ncbi:MAG: UDP-N-acetylglucosamine 2-epimerase (non-hydrolyzing), partial [Burkholderiales bacterium PBB5]
TMIDTLLANLDRLRAPDFWADAGLQAGQYFVMTLHRPANVDDPAAFARLLSAVGQAVRGLPVVFPVHPRTAKTLANLPDKPGGLLMVGPQPYLEFNHLVRHAKGVITDSGGVTEETTVLGVPCVTLRDSTERPETVTVGTNELIGTDPAALKPALDRLFAGQWKKGAIPDKWDGNTGGRIVDKLEQLLGA